MQDRGMILLPLSVSPRAEPAAPVQPAPGPAGGVFGRLVAAITPPTEEGAAEPDLGEDDTELPEAQQVHARPADRPEPADPEVEGGEDRTETPEMVSTPAPPQQGRSAVDPASPNGGGVPETPPTPGSVVTFAQVGEAAGVPAGPQRGLADRLSAAPAATESGLAAAHVSTTHGSTAHGSTAHVPAVQPATQRAAGADRPVAPGDGAVLPRARPLLSDAAPIRARHTAQPASSPAAPASAGAAQPTAAAPAIPLVSPAKPAADPSRHLPPAPDAGPGLIDGPLPAPQPGGGAPDSATLRPATASEVERPALRQIAVALSALSDGQTELRLSPEELGRVRLSLSTSDGMVTLAVQAERPETADLIRRNLDLLAQDFREMGFAGFDFSFGSDTPDQQPEPGGRQAPQPVPDHPEDPGQTILLRGLDLRL